MDDLFPGTWYLTRVDEKHRREYARRPLHDDLQAEPEVVRSTTATEVQQEHTYILYIYIYTAFVCVSAAFGGRNVDKRVFSDPVWRLEFRIILLYYKFGISVSKCSSTPRTMTTSTMIKWLKIKPTFNKPELSF